MDSNISTGLYIYFSTCIHIIDLRSSIVLIGDVHTMPRACSSAEILHGAPKHCKTLPLATQNRPHDFEHIDVFQSIYVYAYCPRALFLIFILGDHIHMSR